MATNSALATVNEDDGIRQLPTMPTAQRLAMALPSLDELKVLEIYGEMFAKSGLFPNVKTWQAAAAIIQYGSQLGIDAFTALKDIYWINGKPTCDASLINSLIKRDHGGDALMPVEATAERCTIRFKRREWAAYEEATVTAADYQHLINDRSRLPWQNHRADMLWARNVSQIGRRHFSDTIKGLYTREEMRDAVEAEWSPVAAATAPDDSPGFSTLLDPDIDTTPPIVSPKPDTTRSVVAKRLYATIRDRFGKDEDASAIGHDLVCIRFGLKSTKDATTDQLREAIGAVEGWSAAWTPKALNWLRIIAQATTPTMVADVAALLDEQGVTDLYLMAALAVAQERYPIPDDVFAASGRVIDGAMVP
jgi:hypothetical protein